MLFFYKKMLVFIIYTIYKKLRFKEICGKIKECFKSWKLGNKGIFLKMKEF